VSACGMRRAVAVVPPIASTAPAHCVRLSSTFSFRVLHRSKRSQARVGVLTTPHGSFETPAFVPVATNGILKHVDLMSAREEGSQLVFSNTYHLLIHPGPKVIKDAGGLHSFTGYHGPLITDSGGFQIFSLIHKSVTAEVKELKQAVKSRYADELPLVKKIDEDGVTFRSYRDGRLIRLTPESSVAAQKDFGADIIIPLDILPPYHTNHDELVEKMQRTHRWEQRSLLEHLKSPNSQAMYSVIHGGVDETLRTQSAQLLSSLPFDGHAIGGSLGKSTDDILRILGWVMPCLPPTHPVHLLGIGDLPSVQAAVPMGVDTFDSSFPTKLGRHGTLLTRRGKLRVTNRKFSDQHHTPVDDQCGCHTCRHYSRSYLHHLFKTAEPAGLALATAHNLRFMFDFMAALRARILNDDV